MQKQSQSTLEFIKNKENMKKEMLRDVTNEIVETTYLDKQNKSRIMYECSSLGALLVITLGPKAQSKRTEIRTILTRIIIEHIGFYETIINMNIFDKLNDIRRFSIDSRELLTNAVNRFFPNDDYRKYSVMTNLTYSILNIKVIRFPKGYKEKGVHKAGYPVNAKRAKLTDDVKSGLSIIETAVSDILNQSPVPKFTLKDFEAVTYGRGKVSKEIYREVNDFIDLLKYGIMLWTTKKVREEIRKDMELKRVDELNKRMKKFNMKNEM
jgi:hypothetical protein